MAKALLVTAPEVTAARAFIKAIGGNVNNYSLITAVVAWLHAESGGLGGVIGNNPFNLRPGADDKSLRTGIRRSKKGNGYFSTYRTIENGMIAAARRLIALGGMPYGYQAIVIAARAGNVQDFLMAIALSAWDGGVDWTKGGHYGLKKDANGHVYGINKLITLYNQFTGLTLPQPKAGTTAKAKPAAPPPPVVGVPPVHYFTDAHTVAGFYRAKHTRASYEKALRVP